MSVLPVLKSYFSSIFFKKEPRLLIAIILNHFSGLRNLYIRGNPTMHIPGNPTMQVPDMPPDGIRCLRSFCPGLMAKRHIPIIQKRFVYKQVCTQHFV